MRVVFYLRYSSQNQDEFSIEGQRQFCQEYAKIKNYDVVGEYVDRAQSAKTDNRPEFKHMIKDSSKDMFDAIIVYQFDRFARNRLDSQYYKKLLKDNNVAVLSAREELPDDISKIVLEGFLEAMAEYFSADLGQKVLRGMKTNAIRHYYNGGSVPLGFKLEVAEVLQTSNKIKEKKRFVIDEEKAPIVKTIFEKFNKGESMINIIRYLNKLGIKTSKNMPFNKNSIRRILENKKYIGVYSYDGVDTPDAIPRIISDDLFYKVQDKLGKYRCAPGRQKARTEYLLTTKLFCGYCENMMVGVAGTSKNGTLHNYYTCKGRKTCGCKKHNIKKTYIEDIVVDMAREVLTDKEIPIIAKNVVEYAEKHDNSDLKYLQDKLKDLKRQNESLTNSLKYCEVDAVRKTIIDEMSKIENEKINTINAIKEEEKNHTYIEYDKVVYFLEQMRNGNVNDMRYRQRLINCFINKVFLWDDKIIISFNIKKSDIATKLPDLKDLECSFEVSNGAPLKNLVELWFNLLININSRNGIDFLLCERKE